MGGQVQKSAFEEWVMVFLTKTNSINERTLNKEGGENMLTTARTSDLLVVLPLRDAGEQNCSKVF